MLKIEKLQPLTIFILYIVWASFWLTFLGSIASNGGFVMTLQQLFSEFYANVSSELVSIAVTVVIVDRLNRQRNREERKLELFDQTKSRMNVLAVDALEKIQRAGWEEEMLEHYRNERGWVNLSHVQWSGGVTLQGANLEWADLRSANLEDVKWALDDDEFPATLPDGTTWTPKTDVERFTNPEHPEFWSPADKQS